jgi:hypothetical protein
LIGAENHAENYCRSAQPPQQKSSGAVFTGALLLFLDAVVAIVGIMGIYVGASPRSVGFASLTATVFVK